MIVVLTSGASLSQIPYFAGHSVCTSTRALMTGMTPYSDDSVAIGYMGMHMI